MGTRRDALAKLPPGFEIEEAPGLDKQSAPARSDPMAKLPAGFEIVREDPQAESVAPHAPQTVLPPPEGAGPVSSPRLSDQNQTLAPVDQVNPFGIVDQSAEAPGYEPDPTRQRPIPSSSAIEDVPESIPHAPATVQPPPESAGVPRETVKKTPEQVTTLPPTGRPPLPVVTTPPPIQSKEQLYNQFNHVAQPPPQPKPTGFLGELKKQYDTAPGAMETVTGPNTAVGKMMEMFGGKPKGNEIPGTRPTARDVMHAPLVNFGNALPPESEDVKGDWATKASRGVLEGMSGLTNPKNLVTFAGLLATAGSSAIPAVVSRLITAGFSLEMIAGLWHSGKEFKAALESGDSDKAAKIAGKMAVEAGMTAVTSSHAIGFGPKSGPGAARDVTGTGERLKQLGTGDTPGEVKPPGATPRLNPEAEPIRPKPFEPEVLEKDYLPADPLKKTQKLLAENNQAEQLKRERDQALEHRDTARREALTDKLTGLGNQAAWQEAAPGGMPASSSENKKREVATFDVKNLKAVNELENYEAGNTAIKRAADAVRAAAKSLGHEVPAFRSGAGDEISIIAEKGTAQPIIDRAIELYGKRSIGESEYETALRGGSGISFTEAEKSMKAAKADEEEAFRKIEPAPIGKPVPQQPGDVTHTLLDFPIDQLNADPERFQYKRGASTSGTVESSAVGSAGKWNPNLSGTLQAWKDPSDGKYYVVNGHNRRVLALKSGAKTFPRVQVLDASTAQEAMGIGALTNIVEGMGTPIDAAKFLRNNKSTPEVLRELGVPMRGEMVDKGMALANLNDSLFSKVATGDLPEAIGVIIGRKLKDHDLQTKLVQMLRGKNLPGKVINELVDIVADAPRTKTVQTGLFGDQEFTESYAVQKAQVLSHVRSEISRDRSLFGKVAKHAERLGQAGIQIPLEEAKGMSAESAQLLGIFDAVKNKVGTIDQIINQAAEELGKGGNSKDILKRATEAIKAGLPEVLKGTAAPRGEAGQRVHERPEERPAIPPVSSPTLQAVKPPPAEKPTSTLPTVNPPETKSPRKLTVFHGGPKGALEYPNWPKWFTTHKPQAEQFAGKEGEVRQIEISPNKIYHSKLTLPIEQVEKIFDQGYDAIYIGNSIDTPIDVILPGPPESPMEKVAREMADAGRTEKQKAEDELVRSGKGTVTRRLKDVEGPLFGNEPKKNQGGLFGNEEDRSTLKSSLLFGAEKPIAAAVKKFYESDIKPGAQALAAGLGDTKQRFLHLVIPKYGAPDIALHEMFRLMGDRNKQEFELERRMDHIKRMFAKMPREEQIDFIDRYKRGENQPTAELTKIAALYHDIDTATHQELVKWKPSLPFLQDHFRVFWKVIPGSKTGKVTFRGLFRRPLEGDKGFMKKHTLADISEGLERGGIPHSYNPQVLFELGQASALKYITAQRMFDAMKKAGLARFVSPNMGIPAGFVRIDDRIAKVWLNPNIPIAEGYDQIMFGKLNDFARSLGISLFRKVKMPGGEAWGLAYNDGRIITKFAGPESVLTHEIGHQLDWKFGLKAKLVDPQPTGNVHNKGKNAGKPIKKASIFTKELRALADLRLEGSDPASIPEHYRKYVREGPEKMANLVHAYIHAPELLSRIAPLTMAALNQIIDQNSQLHPLRDIKPSLVLGVGAATVPAGGPVVGGEWAFEANTARLINNYLSRDLVRETALGRGIMKFKNVTTAMELALSPFHAVFETIEAMSTQSGIGMMRIWNEGIRQGRLDRMMEGLRDIASSPVAPWTAATLGGDIIEFAKDPESFIKTTHGAKFLKQYPEALQFVEDLFHGGAALQMHQDYKINTLRTFEDNWKESNYIGVTLRLIPAASELLMKPLFEVYIPRLKLGFFFKRYSQLLSEATSAGEEAPDAIERGKLAREAWDHIESVFGEMNFDNLMWNRTFKTVLQMMFRSVTWKLGSIRNIGSALTGQASEFSDALKLFEKGPPQGPPKGPDVRGPFDYEDADEDGGEGFRDESIQDVEGPDTEGTKDGKYRWRGPKIPRLDPNMAWMLGFLATTVILSEIIQRLFGQGGIKDLKDAVHPRVGGTDNRGKPNRVSLPTYYKDLEHIAASPLGYVRSSLSGMVGRSYEAWENEDFFGNFVYDKNEPAYKQLADIIQHIVSLPFSVRNMQEIIRGGGSNVSSKLGFAGLTKGPRGLDYTPAESAAVKFLSDRRPRGQTSKASAQERIRINELIFHARTREPGWQDDFREAGQAGTLSQAEIRSIQKAASGKTSDWLREMTIHLPLDDAITVWDKSDQAEQARLKPVMGPKVERFQKNAAPEDVRALKDRIKHVFPNFNYAR